MKEFVEKLNNKLDELITDTYYKSVKGSKIAGIKNNAYHALKEFINQLAEEHKPVILEVLLEMLIEAKRNCGEDSDCSECPFGQIEDRCILAELQMPGIHNGYCVWEYDEFEEKWQTDCGVLFALHDSDREITKYCPCCGKKIKVVE